MILRITDVVRCSVFYKPTHIWVSSKGYTMIPFSKFKARDSKAGGEIIIEACTGKDEANGFLNDYLAHLAVKVNIVGKALAKSEADILTAEAKESDDIFDSSLVDYRSIIRAKSAISSLGVEQEACTTLYDGLIRHGGDIENLPRHEQITAMDNYITEFSSEQNSVLFEKGRVSPVFAAVKESHFALKAKESERSANSITEGAIPGEFAAATATNKVLSRIYNHIVHYSQIDKMGYAEILTELDTKLAPIVTQVKARITRSKSEAAEELILN